MYEITNKVIKFIEETMKKLFAKNEKELETLIEAVGIFSQDIRKEFGIGKCAMLIMRSGKRQMMEGIELPNQEKMRTIGEKETYEYLGVRGSGHHQTRGDERKKWKKCISGERESYLKPNYVVEISQRDKYLGRLPCKLLGTVLEMDAGRTSTKGP